MRLPNPWILIPTLAAALGGAVVGYFVTNASCSPDGCVPLAAGVATISGLITAVGVAIVVVLAGKSLSEWQTHADREILTEDQPDTPPGPPTC
jgi:hypothetical protein